ncbi:hypothetical protein CP157_03894 (plasmid) [Paracoccus marcusii]|uniref:hypothetical protein n=1 Tax=Paracoccus marcusii TaxID=59779 RepID=UPI001C3E6EAC|nr:hypothetical protein [Paracoccus marcusii]QXI66102.1 hypothetical protein CP157_03894 [Paracoccus marcusii]
MKSAATKLFQNRPAALAARVVSAPVTHPGGTTYQGVLACIPMPPPELSKLLEPAADHPHKNYSSSREAAHAGDALQRYFKRERLFYDLAFLGMARLPLKSREAEEMRLVLGFGQRGDDPRVCGTAAQPILRAAFGFALHEVVVTWAHKTKREAFTLTLIRSEWRRSRKLPMMNITSMTHIVKKALDDIGFEGLLMIEVQGMRNQAKGLHFHVHGVISPKREGALTEKKARARLSKLFPSVDGAKGVVMKPCKNAADVEHFLMYSAKSPDKVKRIYTDAASSSPTRIREGRQGYSSVFALDLLTVRSRLSLPTLIIAHGKRFKRMKTEIKAGTEARLEAWGVTRVKNDQKKSAAVWRRILNRHSPKNGFGLPLR